MSEYFMSTALPTSVVPARQNNTAYLVGDFVYHAYSGRFLQCVAAGTSGTTGNFNCADMSGHCLLSCNLTMTESYHSSGTMSSSRYKAPWFLGGIFDYFSLSDW